MNADFIVKAITYKISKDTIIWANLPKIIWIYRKTSSDYNLIDRLCLKNIERSALSSNFTISILN